MGDHYLNGYDPQLKRQKQTYKTNADVLARIYQIGESNPQYATELMGRYQKLAANPQSTYYRPYESPTNRAVANLAAYGIDASQYNSDWFKNNTSWQNYLVYDGTTNNPTKPKKGMSNEYQVAYQIYQLWRAEDDTIQAENQWADLQKELTYWAQQTDRNYTDDEIISKIDWSKYSQLQEMNNLGSIAPKEYNRAIGYSMDAVKATIWKARNPEYQGDMNGAIAYNTLGKGNQWQENPEITAKLDVGNKDTYAPYSVGCTMDKERAYFGVPSFTQKWVDDNYAEIMGGNNETAKKYLVNVIDALDYTKKVKQQLADMDKEIDDYIKSGVYDFAWISDQIKQDSAYKDLFDMDDTLVHGDMGLKNITEAVDFRWKDKEAEIRERCNKTFANNIANGAANLVDTLLGVANVAGTISNLVQDAVKGAKMPDEYELVLPRPTPRPDYDVYGNKPATSGGTTSGVVTGLAPDATPTPPTTQSVVNTPTPTQGVVTTPTPTPDVTNTPAPDVTNTPAPYQYQQPMLSPSEKKIEEASIADLNDVSSTVYSAGTKAEKTALLTGNTSYQDACIERLKNRATDTIKGYVEGSSNRANKTYYNSYSIANNFEKIQKSIADKKEELESYTQEWNQLNEIRSQDEATAGMDSEEYTNLMAFKGTVDNATWNIVKHELRLGPGEPDPYDDSNDRTLGYTEALKSLYRIVTMTDPNDQPEGEVLEKAKLWWGYISRQNDSPVSRLVFEANRNGDDTGELELEEGNMLIRLEKGEDGQFAFAGAKDMDTGEVYGPDWQTEVDRKLGYNKLGADELDRLNELGRRMDTLEQEIYEGEEYISQNSADYAKAKQDRDFTRVIYNEACNIAAASGKEMDRHVLDKIEAVNSMAGEKTEKEYSAQTYYDYQADQGSITREAAAELATKDRDNLSDIYRTYSDMFAYLNEIGVQFDDESRKNVTDYLANLNGHAIDASYVALDSNPDFQSVVDQAAKDAAEGKYGVFGQAVAEYLADGDTNRLSRLAELGWGDVDVINEEECRRWLYMSGTDDSESAKNYLKRLSNPDNGALTVRKMLNVKQEAYDYASQPGLNTYVATAGGIAAKLFSWPASMLYRAIQGGMMGKEVSPYNRALRGQAYAEASLAGVKDAIVKSSQQLFGENSILEQALTKTYDVGVGAAQMAANSAAVGQIFSMLGAPLEAFASGLSGTTPLSVKLLTSAAEVVPTTLESAESTYWKTLQKTDDPEKAGLMYNVSLVTGLITHSVVMNGMHNAVQTNPEAVSSGIAGLIERVISTDASVGASTLTSSAITKLADKAIMKADSQWNENFEYYKSQGYPRSAAEQMADQDMWQSVLDETVDSIINATIRTVAMAGANYAGTKIEQGISKLKNTWANVQEFMRHEFAPDTKHWGTDDNGQAIALEDISPELFERKPSGYDTATRSIVDADGNFVAKVPDDMVDSRYGETSMINRETGDMFTAIGYVFRNGEVNFVTSQGQLVPFENVGSNFNNYETPSTPGYNIQREYALMDEAYQYATGVAARDYYNEQVSQMADIAEDEYAEGKQSGTPYQQPGSYLGLPANTWGAPTNEEQAESLSKDLETVNAIYGTTPTAASTGLASVLDTGDSKLDKAAGQTVVSDLAYGDSNVVSMVMAQSLRNYDGPYGTEGVKTAIAQASMTSGEGNKALRAIFDKTRNGEPITREDVTDLVQKTNDDRRNNPDAFEEELRSRTRELAVAEKTNRVVASRKNEIKGKQQAVQSAQATLSDKKQELEDANANLATTKQTASKNIESLKNSKKKEDNGPVQQSLNEVKGADALARQKENEVAVQERKVEQAQADLQDTQNQIVNEARAEAITAVAQEEQQELEAKAAAEQQEAEQAIAKYTPSKVFSKPITVEQGGPGDDVTLVGVFAKTPDGKYVYSTTQGYVSDSFLGAWSNKALSVFDPVTSGLWGDTKNPVEPVAWMDHSLDAASERDGDVTIIGFVGQSGGDNPIVMASNGKVYDSLDLLMKKDPFTGENGDDALFNAFERAGGENLPEVDPEELFAANNPDVQLPEGTEVYPGGSITVTSPTGEQYDVVGIHQGDEDSPLAYVTSYGTLIDATEIQDEPPEFVDWLYNSLGEEPAEPESYESDNGELIYPNGPVGVTAKTGEHFDITGVYMDPDDPSLPLQYITSHGTMIDASSVESEPQEFTQWKNQALGIREQDQGEVAEQPEAEFKYKVSSIQSLQNKILVSPTVGLMNSGSEVIGISFDSNGDLIYIKSGGGYVDAHSDDVDNKPFIEWAIKALDHASEIGAVDSAEISEAKNWLTDQLSMASSDIAVENMGYGPDATEPASYDYGGLKFAENNHDIVEIPKGTQVTLKYKYNDDPRVTFPKIKSFWWGNNLVDSNTGEKGIFCIQLKEGNFGYNGIIENIADVNQEAFNLIMDAIHFMKDNANDMSNPIPKETADKYISYLSQKFPELAEQYNVQKDSFVAETVDTTPAIVSDPLTAMTLGKKNPKTDESLYDWQNEKYHGAVRNIKKTTNPKSKKFKEWQHFDEIKFYNRSGSPTTSDAGKKYFFNPDGSVKIYYRGYGSFGHTLYVTHESKPIQTQDGETAYVNFYMDNFNTAKKYAGTDKITDLRYIDNWETAKAAMEDIGFKLITRYDPSGSGTPGYQVVTANGNEVPTQGKNFFKENELARFRKTYGGNPLHEGIHVGFITGGNVLIMDNLHCNYSEVGGSVTAPDGSHMSGHHRTRRWAEWAFSHGYDTVIFDNVQDNPNGHGGEYGIEVVTKASDQFKSVFNKGSYSHNKSEILAMKKNPKGAAEIKKKYSDPTTFAATGLDLSPGFKNARTDLRVGKPMEEMTPQEKAAFMDNLMQTPELLYAESNADKEPTLSYSQVNAIRSYIATGDGKMLEKANLPQKTVDILKSGGEYEEAIESLFTPEDVEEIHRIKEYLAHEQGSAVFDSKGDASYTGPVNHDRIVHFILGLPASGKSSLADPLSYTTRSIILDSDTAKAVHKKNQGGGNDGPLHAESRYIASLAQKMIIDEGTNCVVPIVGYNFNSVRRQVDAFKDGGYKVYVHKVDLPWNEAIARTLNRLAEKNRYLSLPYITGTDGSGLSPEGINLTYDRLTKGGYVDGYAEWDNDVEKGQPPILRGASDENIGRIAGGTFGEPEGYRYGDSGRGSDDSEKKIQALKKGYNPKRKPTTRTEVQAAKVKNKLKSPQDIMTTLIKELSVGNYLGTNKFGAMQSAEGYYDPHGKLIATKRKNLGEASVGGHEAGHAIFDMIDMKGTDEMVKRVQQPEFNTENINFAAYEPSMIRSEAEAEFFRRYLKSEAEARALAGDEFYDEFEQKIATKPKLYKAISKARDEMRQWYEANEDAKFGSVIKYDKYPYKEAAEQVVKNVIARLVDKSAPAEEVNNMIRQATGKNTIPFEQDARANSLMANHAQKKASFILNEFMTDPDANIIDDGLVKAVFVNTGLKPTKDNIHELNKFITARNASARREQMKELFTKDITDEDVANYINKIIETRPEVVDAADALTAWWRKFRNAWLVDRGGRLPQKVADMWDEMYPYYAPAIRVGSPVDANFGYGKNSRREIKFREATGGTQDIFSPLHSYIGMVYQIVDTVMLDEAGRAFDNAYMNNPALGAIARLVPGTSKEEKAADASELNSRQKQLMDLLNDHIGDDLMEQVLEITESKPGFKQMKQEPGFLTVHRNDGTVVRYQFENPYLYGLLAGVRTDEGAHPVMNAIGSFTRFMSKLTTGSNPYFALRNFTRDYQTSVNYGTWAPHGDYITAFPTWLSAAIELARGESDAAKKYLALGGGGWTRGNINDQKGMRELAEELFGHDISTVTGFIGAIADKVTDLLTLERFNEFIEQGSRFVEFARGKHDLSTPEGAKEAFLASQDVSVDFTRKGIGPEAYFLSKTVPFFAASANGVYRTGRQFTQAERGNTGWKYDEETGETKFDAKETFENFRHSRAKDRVVKTVFNMGLTSALAIGSIMLFGDDELKEQYNKLSDEIKKNHIIVPNPLRHVNEGSAPFIRIPIEQDPLAYAVNWGVTNALWNGENDDMAIGFGALASAVWDNINPISGTIIQPFVDASHHRTYYGSSTIRSSQLEWDDPTAQYNEDTPQAFRLASRFLNTLGIGVSPEDIEYMTQQYTGFIGQTVIPALSYEKNGKMGGLGAMAKTFTNQWTADATRSSTVISDFKKMNKSLQSIVKQSKANRAYNSFRRSLSQKEIDQAYLEAEELINKGGLAYETNELINEMYKDIDEINGNPLLTDSQKAKLARDRKMETMRTVEKAYDQLLEYYDKYMKDESILDSIMRIREGKIAHVPTKEERIEDVFKADSNSSYMKKAMSVYNGKEGKDANGYALGGKKNAALPHPERKQTLTLATGKKMEIEITDDKEWQTYVNEYKKVYQNYIDNSKDGKMWDKADDAKRYKILQNAHRKASEALRELYAKNHNLKLK